MVIIKSSFGTPLSILSFGNKINSCVKFIVLINFDKEVSSISLYEESSLVFLKIFPFGTNSILRDVIQLCSLKENEARVIIRKSNLIDNSNNKNKYVEKDLFTESEFKKLRKPGGRYKITIITIIFAFCKYIRSSSC